MKKKLAFIASLVGIFVLLFGLFFARGALAVNYTLSGTVQDSAGMAVEGATVSVNDPGVSAATTNDSGFYTMSVPAGTHTIYASPPTGSELNASEVIGHVISGNDTVNFSLAPSSEALLLGHLYDGNGNPLAGQVVDLGVPNASTVTDAAGGFYISTSPGSFTLSVSNSNGYTPGAHTATYYEASVSNFSLMHSKTFDIILPFKQVTVQERDVSENPVANVGIQAFSGAVGNEGNHGFGSPAHNSLTIGGGLSARVISSYQANPGGVATTDASGNATLWLFPNDANYDYTLTSIPPNGSGFLTTKTTGVSVTSDITKTVMLRQPVTFSGTINDASGTPLAGQNISLHVPGTSATTDANGAFSITAAPGTYTLEIGNSGNYIAGQHVASYYNLTSPNFSLEGDRSVAFTLPFKQVTVQTKDASGDPVSGVKIQAVSGAVGNQGNHNFGAPAHDSLAIADGITARVVSDYVASPGGLASTDASGTATLWLFPNSQFYDYTFTSTPPTGSGLLPTTTTEVSVTGDMTKTITLQRPVTLSGHLYDSSGNPLADKSIDLGAAGTSVITDAAGAYSITASAGTYPYFRVTSNTYMPGTHISTFYSATSYNFSLTQNRTLDITLPFKRVQVQLKDAAANPIAGASIHAVSGLVGNEGNHNFGSPAHTSLNIGGGLNATVVSDYIAGIGGLATTDAAGNATLWLFQNDAEHDYTFTVTPASGTPYLTQKVNGIKVTGDQTEVITLGYSHATPTTTVSLSPSPGANGSYEDPVTVTLTASAASGYAIADTYYTVDGGSRQEYSAPFTVSGNGSHTIAYWSVDNSGVTEPHRSKTFTIQALVAPANLRADSPTKNPALVWDGVPDATSYNIYRGGAKIGSSQTTTYTDNTAPEGSNIYYVTAANAGGEGPQSNSITVLVDRTLPAITYTISPAPNAAGWNNTNVTVTFACSDASSGIATCSGPVTMSTEGAHQTVVGTATDKAGNMSTVTATVKLDKTPPTIADPIMSNRFFILSGTATFSATTADALSGVTGGEYYIDIDPGQGNGMSMTYANGQITSSATFSGRGVHRLFMRSHDAAGNWSVSVFVGYFVLL